MSNPAILQGLLSASPEFNATQAQQQPAAPAVDTRVPAPQVPMRPAGQADFQQTPTEEEGEDLPLHPVDNMAMAYMGQLLTTKNEAEQKKAVQDGSFRSKLQGALSSAAAGLGDMRTPSDPNSGWLGAVGATLNQRTNRKRDEEAAAFERKERVQNDQINLAKANLAMRAEAMQMQKQEKEVRDQSAQAGSAFIDAVRDNYKVTDNISQDQLQKMATDDPKFLQTHTARITSYKPVMNSDGSPRVVDGVPVEEPVWSIADMNPGDTRNQFKVTPALSKRWADAGLQTITPGTIMPATVANDLSMKAQRYGSTLSILDHARVTALPDDVKEQLSLTLQDPEVQHAIGSKPGSPLDGLYEAKTNIQQHIDQLQQNIGRAQGPGADQAIQQQLQKYQQIDQNLDKAINLGFSPEDRKTYAKELMDDRKATREEKREDERIQHDRNTEMIALDKIKALQASNDPADARKLGEFLADGMMDISQLSKRAKNYNSTITAANEISMQKYGLPFEEAQAGLDFKYAGQKSTKDTLNFLNSLVGSDNASGNLGTLLQQSNALPRTTSIPALDDKVAWAKLEAGDPRWIEYHTTITGIADEVAKILQGGGSGGGTSDAKMRQAQELFRLGYNKADMDAVTKDLRGLLSNRKNEMIGKNRYLIREYGNATWKPGMEARNIAANQPPTKLPGEGKTFDVNAWISKNPHGSKDAAIAQAKQQGYAIKGE